MRPRWLPMSSHTRCCKDRKWLKSDVFRIKFSHFRDGELEQRTRNDAVPLQATKILLRLSVTISLAAQHLRPP